MEDFDVKASNGTGKQLSGGDNEEAEVFYSDPMEDECQGNSCSSSETCSSAEAQSSGIAERRMKRHALGWPMCKASIRHDLLVDELGSDLNVPEPEKLKYSDSDVELMKERFSKLLLGEDMSGCGKGVCAASAMSNAITNLCATVFGQLWRLEPLTPEKKSMWRREMEWLVCVSDHIVELVPSWQTFPDGSKLEVMTCRPRSDLFVSLPALRKLDHMLLEILDSFSDREFWYVDQGILASDSDDSTSFRRSIQRQEEKWWLPVPRVPQGGLHENTRTKLQHTRECTNQILKAAMAINSDALIEMEVPESYLNSLPKNGRASLGDLIYRYICSVQFSPECVLDCLNVSSEHQALEIANRFESAMYVWRKQSLGKHVDNRNSSGSKSSWSVVKDMLMDADKREMYADRAESLLVCLKQRFPGLRQTTLDMTKIQFNKDVGKSILESYSRVLESLAFNIVARIDELIYVDDLSKHSDKFDAKINIIIPKKAPTSYSTPPSGSALANVYNTRSFSPACLVSPDRGEHHFQQQKPS